MLDDPLGPKENAASFSRKRFLLPDLQLRDLQLRDLQLKRLTAPAMTSSSREVPELPGDEWFRSHFNRDYLLLYEARSEEQAAREVEFASAQLRLSAGSRVLDLCCGHGRHLEALLERDLDAWGLDLSLPLLEVASRRTAIDARKLVCADMRELPFADAGTLVDAGAPVDAGAIVDAGTLVDAGALADGGSHRGFDAVVCFFTSFGYFETDGEHSDVAAEIFRVLEPGGKLALDLMNPGPTLSSLVPESTRERAGFHIEESRRFDPKRRRLEKTLRMIDIETGSAREYFESVRLFELEEIRAILEGVGFRILEVFGDLSGQHLDSESPRLVITARRPI